MVDIDWLIEQAEQFQELEDRHYRQELIDEHIERLEQQNKRYREAIEHTKLKLKDFRRSANNTFKLIDPRNRVAKEEVFRLQCDIRYCLEALDKKPDDRTVESPHSTWF